MRNILAIAGKELRALFLSPIAYVVLCIFGLIFGIVFSSTISQYLTLFAQASRMGQPMPGEVHDILFRPMLGFIATITLFLVPMISMRLFAEEKRSGTIELLLTSPIRDYEIVLGKWLAAIVLYVAVLGISMLNFGLLLFYSQPEWKPLLVGYLGLLLSGAAILTLGTYLSSITRNQIVAVTATFFASVGLWIIDIIGTLRQDAWAQVISYLSVLSHFQPFAQGLIQTKDVVYFVCFIFFWLFMTVRSLEALRWKA
jgi:ABC-2 type transport system permease protein